MKYRYDWAEIKHASDLWCYQLSRMDEVFQGDNPVIDTADIRYIREVMDRNPKLERLMPCLRECCVSGYCYENLAIIAY
jgi:hypothetical protein